MPTAMLNVAPIRTLLLIALVAVAGASIERLTLRQMIAKTDGGVVGEITGKQVFVVDLGPGYGEQSYTTLTVTGTNLVKGSEQTIEVSYPGGILPDGRGSYNSEAPKADAVRLGRKVLVFYKTVEDLGGGVPGHLLNASHGGLFTTFQDKKGRVIVQGRGDGYAVPKNILLTDLVTAAKKHDAELRRERESGAPPQENK